MADRRQALTGLAVAAGAMLLGGHTPYRQWVVYRKKHLLIGCHRADPPTYDLAKQAVAMLDAQLPDARARVARAPDARRLASLLATGQLDVAILGRPLAEAMRAGAAPFEPYGPVPVSWLAPLGAHVIICRDDFSTDHAAMVVEALSEMAMDNPSMIPGNIPRHPGAQASSDGVEIEP